MLSYFTWPLTAAKNYLYSFWETTPPTPTARATQYRTTNSSARRVESDDYLELLYKFEQLQINNSQLQKDNTNLQTENWQLKEKLRATLVNYNLKIGEVQDLKLKLNETHEKIAYLNSALDTSNSTCSGNKIK